MEDKLEYHQNDVNIVGSYFALKDIITGNKRKVHAKFDHMDYLASHLSLMMTILNARIGNERAEFVLSHNRAYILKSDDPAFVPFFCMELVTRHRQTLTHFLTHQMERYHEGEKTFLKILKQGTIKYLITNDPFQDESLLQFLNDWIEKHESQKELMTAIKGELVNTLKEMIVPEIKPDQQTTQSKRASKKRKKNVVGKKSSRKGKMSVGQYALYYFYLQNVQEIESFINHKNGVEGAYREIASRHNFSANHFKQKFTYISKSENRFQVKHKKDLEAVIKHMAEFPKAKASLEKDLAKLKVSP